MTTKGSQRRSQLFRAGAAALARFHSDEDAFYACPICGWAFPEEAVDGSDLTLEHVPPKSIGAQLTVLTCRRCNSRTGHTIDAAADRRAAWNDFQAVLLRKEVGERTHSIRLRAGETSLVSDLSGGADGMVNLNIVKEANSEAEVAEQMEYLRSAAASDRWTEQELTLSE